ncbi:hypothetical protein IGI04_041536 [Brassica rapa subsp. trilocularis]|uniref:Uncharacterized protein n=1 Tax=Brassica rapa subsp. trilocularis TaxID=1813537 RepID=A0ABQ7KTZ4_BRACM|nr:hypothetical protein IGI04_041536 [Brassica rapa subsp. trilocularis]
MAAMRYKGSVFITFIVLSVFLLQCPLAHSSSTKLFWLAETEGMNAMKKEHEIDVGSASEAEERKVPTGADPLHHHHIPFASP